MVDRIQLEQAFADLRTGRIDEIAIPREDFDGLATDDHRWLIDEINSLVTKERVGDATRSEDGVLRIRLPYRSSSRTASGRLDGHFFEPETFAS
jgi:hypothetical protein